MSSDTVAPPVTTWRQILAILGTFLLGSLAAAPVTLGFCAGLAFSALRWLAAATVEGFHAGNGSGVDT